jgi:hypothetical protein
MQSKKSSRQFKKSNAGLAPMQVVIILAITSAILIAAATVGDEVVGWMKYVWSSLSSR